MTELRFNSGNFGCMYKSTSRGIQTEDQPTQSQVRGVNPWMNLEWLTLHGLSVCAAPGTGTWDEINPRIGVVKKITMYDKTRKRVDRERCRTRNMVLYEER